VEKRTLARKMIQVTETAAKHLIRLIAKEPVPPVGVRIAVAGGGCSGLSYKLVFETEQRPGDRVFEQHGVRVLCDMKSLLYLKGTLLDFSDGFDGKGFQFKNPNAKSTCGCGNSFST
jgi:iron-sulfur cluster assembly protein